MKLFGKLAVTLAAFGIANIRADEIYQTNYGDVSRKGENVKYIY